MSTSDAIVAAIDEHRRAVALVQRLAERQWPIEDAEAAAQQALVRLANMRPPDVNIAGIWFSYLISLGKEGPSLAQIAAVCRIKAKLRWPQVVRGPERWFNGLEAID
jgi:hypothetical protein